MSSEVVIDRPLERETGGRRKRLLDRAISHVMGVVGSVRSWMGVNEDRVAKVYLTSEDENIHLYVIAKSTAYDFALTDSLAGLVIELVRTGVPLLGTQIPDGTPDELAAYFDPSRALILAIH